MSDNDWTSYQKILDFFRLRSRAYRLKFPDVKYDVVLKDLAKFCYANKVPRFTDLYRLGVVAGRREVWLRIQDHLNLSAEELNAIYNEQSSLQPPRKE